jgi:ABC-type branched-subunit amino acid transport system permease subunit
MNVLNPEFWIFVMVVAGIYAVFSLGLQLQFGYGGILNFGQVAFALVATYTMGILVVRHGVDLWIASLIAVGLAMVAGMIAAVPTLRLRAFYLGIATIAMSEIMRYLAQNLQGFTGGPQGSPNLLGPGFAGTYTKQWFALLNSIKEPLEPILGDLATRDTAMLIIVWTIVAVVMVLMSVLVRSPWGRALKAIREDEDAAAAMGKNVFLFRLQTFVIGSAIGGVAGILLALQLAAFQPNDFRPILTFYGFVIVIIAGTARIGAIPIGAIIFAVIFAGTRFFTFFPFDQLQAGERAYARLIIIGVILILFMRFRPQGILGRKEELVL